MTIYVTDKLPGNVLKNVPVVKNTRSMFANCTTLTKEEVKKIDFSIWDSKETHDLIRTIQLNLCN